MKKLLLVIIGALFSATVFAAGMNIGVVDMQKVLGSSTQLKTAAAAFQKQMAPEKTKIEAKQAALKKMMGDLDKNGSVMTATDKQALQSKIATDRQNLMGMMQAVQQKAMGAQQSVMENIQKKIDAILPVIAKKNNLSVVMTREAAIYASSDIDYTDQVIKALNK